MNNGNIILRCINAQPTAEYSHREPTPLISDGSSLMTGRRMWRHTPLTRGKSPPHHLKLMQKIYPADIPPGRNERGAWFTSIPHWPHIPLPF